MSAAVTSKELCSHCGGTGFQGDDPCDFCGAAGWDDYEENSPEDLEETLDRLLESPANQESQRQGDLIDIFRQEY